MTLRSPSPPDPVAVLPKERARYAARLQPRSDGTAVSCLWKAEAAALFRTAEPAEEQTPPSRGSPRAKREPAPRRTSQGSEGLKRRGPNHQDGKEKTEPSKTSRGKGDTCDAPEELSRGSSPGGPSPAVLMDTLCRGPAPSRAHQGTLLPICGPLRTFLSPPLGVHHVQRVSMREVSLYLTCHHLVHCFGVLFQQKKE